MAFQEIFQYPLPAPGLVLLSSRHRRDFEAAAASLQHQQQHTLYGRSCGWQVHPTLACSSPKGL